MKFGMTGLLCAIVFCLGEAAAIGEESSGALKLLFSGNEDVSETWGKLHFGVTPVGLIRECEAAPFTILGAYPLGDGSYEVFARDQVRAGDSSMRVIERKGDEPYDRVVQWNLMRGTTRDGVTFENVEKVHETEPGTWADNFAMAYNPEAKEYLVLNLKIDRSGFAYRGFFSKDGRAWELHPEPLFYEGDAMSVFWSPVLKRFVCVSKSLQPFRKRIIDHGGPTASLKDDSLRDRRVLMMRTSADGRTWEPSVNLSDVWNRHEKKGSIPAGYLTMPDADDPPDLEFYSGNGLWYHDRAYMMVLNYAASAAAPRKHAPQLDNEWWTSRDGLKWERPARGVNALEVFPSVNRLEAPPMLIDGMVRFRVGHLLLGLPEDRFSYVGSRAHGEFSTRAFVMPQSGVKLNAAVPCPERPFAKNQAYVMVGVTDEKGVIIPGYEPEKCVIQNQDGIALPLKWGEKTGVELAGKEVRLRVWTRSANVYAVTGG